MNLLSKGTVSSSSGLTTGAAVHHYFSGADTVVPLTPTAQPAMAREISHTDSNFGYYCMSFNSAVSGRQISSTISVTAVYKGASQESTHWLEMVVAVKLQSAWQADVIKICHVKTHSSTITDLFLLDDFNLGLQ